MEVDRWYNRASPWGYYSKGCRIGAEVYLNAGVWFSQRTF